MQRDFLYASIDDTQGSIRSVDVKAGFLFVILFLPISIIDKISAIYPKLTDVTNVVNLWIAVTVLFWIAAIIVLFRCVVAINNPSLHVHGNRPTGVFFSGDLYKLTIFHVFWNISTGSSRDVAGELGILPSNNDDILKELVFEKIKLSYIRSVKFFRFAVSAWFTAAWLASSGLLALYTRLYS